MSGQSGKGNSSAQTTQQVSNQQVAASSGIAFGAGSSGNKVNISSSDPEVTKAALTAGVEQTAIAGNIVEHGTDSALSFAGHAADVAADTNKFAIQAIQETSGQSIFAQDDLATKFGKNVSDLAAQNVNLLQSVNQEQGDLANKALDTAQGALTQSFAVSRAVAPQDANYTQSDLASTTSKTIVYIVLGIIAILGLGFLFMRRSK